MSEDTRELEAALGSLRPRRLPAGLESRLTAALEAPARPARPRVIPWAAWGGLAAAACLALALSLPDEVVPPAGSEPMAMAAVADAPSPLLRSAPPMAAMRAARAEAPAPGLQLVRAEQSPAEATLLEPVRLSDGLFARPVRVRWHNTAHFRDERSGAELIRHVPHDEVIGLVPFETD
jgi:hypothetical protein